MCKLIRLAAAFLLLGLLADSPPRASAQVVAPVPPTTIELSDRTTTLRDQLVNQLRATTSPQQSFVQAVVAQVAAGRLRASRVIAIQRYALRRSAHYPFPTFERAMRFEAQRRGVSLPTVRLTRQSRLTVQR